MRAAEWDVPFGGNTFRIEPSPSAQGVQADGSLRWRDPAETFALFFHVDRPCRLQLALQGEAEGGAAGVRVGAEGKKWEAAFASGKDELVDLGDFSLKQAGYVKLTFQATGHLAGLRLRRLILRSDSEKLAVTYVRTNEGKMFYWGRRGPSVHLRYPLPEGRKITHAYSEIVVPEGFDPVGSYFMANGFGEGYFGIQVNGPKERRVLFSVWSPFKTDNPRDIPADQRVRLLRQGAGVRVKDFGNEGSGGQSFLPYPWEAGRTYRFLTEVRPNGDGSTSYSAWFGDKARDEWRFIATFRRPKTDTYYRGFHSFLENFSPAMGHLERLSYHENQWVRDSEGQWHELTRAVLSTDATGRGKHRLDYGGGLRDGVFFLRNGGFFSPAGELGKPVERAKSPFRMTDARLPHAR
ncbi:MAG: DUF3472 domain-containing protein [Verrucomicrobiales bacterium]